MAIGLTELEKAKPGDAIVGSDQKQWQILTNERRSEGWRFLCLRPPDGGPERWFWWHPKHQAIVDAESLRPVEAFNSPAARIIAAATAGLS